MLRLSSTLCPFCEATALSRRFGASWTTVRNASTMQKSRPSRMVLSAKAGRPAKMTTPTGRPLRKSKNSPFGGMNVTAPPDELHRARNQVSAAEQKRQTKNRPGKTAQEQKPKEPMRALKMQRALASVSYDRRNRVKNELLDRKSFDDFDLLPVIAESISAQALGGLVDVSPTPIQRLAIPALLDKDDGRRRRRKPRSVTGKDQMEQFLLAAETGSGKTLAYILPLVDAVKRAEAEEALKSEQASAVAELGTNSNRLFDVNPPDMDEPHPTTGRPRAIILVPTAELVSQVGSVLKSLSHTVKFRSAMLSASFSGTVIRNRLFSPAGIDIIVSTPHLLSSITESDPNILSRVSHLVIDEADSLLDRSFSPITSAIIDRATPSLSQLIFCSATIPRSLDSYLNKRYPDTTRLATPHLHAIPRRVQLSVIDIEKVPYQGNRDLACAQTIWDIGQESATAAVSGPDEGREKKIVVFVNEREKTVQLAEYLRSKGIDATALSRDSSERRQAETLAAFTGSNPPSLSAPTPPPSPASRRHLRSTHVLVTTDIASRGIDTLPVRHVILYDVPHTSIDFIHRLGRVGRMGRRGRGVVLVGKHDRKDVVREVREGMFKGQALI